MGYYYQAGSAGAGIAQGAMTGAGVGAQVGSVFGAPGVLIGSGVGALIGGVVGGTSARKKTREVNKALSNVYALNPIDISQIDYIDKLNAQKRAIESGFTNEYQAAKQTLLEQSALSTDALVGLSSGNPVAAMDYIMRMNAGIGNNMNKLLTSVSGRADNYLTAIGAAVNDIAEKKFQTELYKASQGLAMATDNYSTFRQNMNAVSTYSGMEGMSEIINALKTVLTTAKQ